MHKLVSVPFLIVGFLLSLNINMLACDCPVHPGRLNRDKTDSFDVIMRGKVMLSFPCSGKETQTRFSGLELFKGKGIPNILEVTHDCSSACKMPFEKEEEWLLFLRRDSITNTYSVSYCERNRKYIDNPKNDQYTMYNEMSYTEEVTWLRKNMLPVYFLEPEQAETVIKQDLTIIDQNRNIRFASNTQKIVIIVGSFGFMVLLIWLIRRFLK